MVVGSECTSRSHLSCWTEGDCGSSNSSIMVYSKAFSFRLCVKKKIVQHDISDLSIGLYKSAGHLPNGSAVCREEEEEEEEKSVFSEVFFCRNFKCSA